MNAYKRVIKSLNHEEPDRVPLFCQVVMPEFKKKLVKYWGKEYKKEDRYVLYYMDFNLERKLGFDFAWGFNVLPVRLPRNFLKDNPLPQLEVS